MAGNVRTAHRKKRKSINRAFAAPFSPCVRFGDCKKTAGSAKSVPAKATECTHPFADMKIMGWNTSASGKTLTLDAICQRCGVPYSKAVATAAEHATVSIVAPGEHLRYFPNLD